MAECSGRTAQDGMVHGKAARKREICDKGSSVEAVQTKTHLLPLGRRGEKICHFTRRSYTLLDLSTAKSMPLPLRDSLTAMALILRLEKG
jgi:hypothetical protein